MTRPWTTCTREWDVWTQFVTADTNAGLSLDGLRNSHPIEQEVRDPAEIGQLFDAISYSKGGSVLRMLEQFLGGETFRDGLRHYISRQQYDNARTEDLWDSLGEASGQPVTAIMDTWVKQTGYPVLDVQVSREGDFIEVDITQERFVYEAILEPTDSDDAQWRVPVTVRTASDAQPVSTLLEGPHAKLKLRPATYGSTDEWVKLNPSQTGFYRVKYAKDELIRLVPAIRSLVLPAADRLGVQNDTWALARAGHVPATQFLSLAEAYTEESNAFVCADLATNLAGLDTLLRDEPYHERFQKLARSIFNPIGKRTGWDPRPGEGHLEILLRSTVLAQLGKYHDEEALGEAAARFPRYVAAQANVHPRHPGRCFQPDGQARRPVHL